MRPLRLLLLLGILLSACTLQVATPTPEPPSQQASEMLYRALTFQAMTKDAFVIGANAAISGTLSGGDGIGMMLLTAGFMKASAEILEQKFPDTLLPYVVIARQQYTDLATLGKNWLSGGTLKTENVPAALDKIDTNDTLLRYSDFLVSVGYSHDDVEMMDVRFRDELRKRLATPTP